MLGLGGTELAVVLLVVLVLFAPTVVAFFVGYALGQRRESGTSSSGGSTASAPSSKAEPPEPAPPPEGAPAPDTGSPADAVSAPEYGPDADETPSCEGVEDGGSDD